MYYKPVDRFLDNINYQNLREEPSMDYKLSTRIKY